MQKQLEQYFGCKVKISEYKNKLPLPIFMTMRDIMMVEIYGVNFAIIDVVKEMELSVAAMKKQKAKYEEALQCPVAKAYLINPVQKVITVMRQEATFESFDAGETALSQLSELNPPRIEECAIFKGEEVIDQLEIVDARCEDQDDCLNVQLWKYNPSYFAREGRVDPVSLACTFKGNEDERIEICIEELLEEL